jgi:cysteine desulfurase/selenocysteine lyase
MNERFEVPGDVIDAERIRRDFPIFERVVNGHPLVYLDSAATSQKPRQVIDAVSDFYANHNANAHRGIYQLGEEATEAFESARAKLAAFFGAADVHTIVFTRGTTESMNLVAQGWGRKFLREGDEVLLTDMEHHSNIVPWQLTAQVTGAVLRSSTSPILARCSPSGRRSCRSPGCRTPSGRSPRSAS